MTSLPLAQAAEIQPAVARDDTDRLGAPWDHFHRSPELSLMEHDTVARSAKESRAAGFEVIEGVQNGGPPIGSHHSPQFEISSEPAVRSGVEATVHALLDLMPDQSSG